ncbi:MAG: glutathione synthase [Myxococcota bacterium]
MDPLNRINIRGDSTFVMMLEAQRRGIPVYSCEVGDLELHGDTVWARGKRTTVERNASAPFSVGAEEALRLDDLRAVFMRKDPPVDVEFFMSLHLLDRADRQKVVMVNDPASIAVSNEKLFAMNFPELTPKTMVSRRPDRIRAFIEEHGDVVVKPLNGAGGSGILRLVRGDKNIRSAVELLTQEGKVSIAVQVYLPKVTEGDRRVLLIDGQAVGVINRRPQADDIRSNMHVGGTAEATELNAADLHIAATIGPELRRLGLVFVGIDVIDGRLTEINVTSPTGLQEYARFSGVHLEEKLIDSVEAKAAALG